MPSEVWFPAAMVLAGVILANVVTYVQGEVGYRRQRKSQKAEFDRSAIVELQECLNSLGWNLVLFSIAVESKGSTRHHPGELLDYLMTAIARGKLLTARLEDAETRKLAGVVLDIVQFEIQDAFDTGKENATKKPIPKIDVIAGPRHDLGGSLEAFNARVRVVLASLYV